MSLPTFTAGTEIKASEMNEAFATIFDMMYPVGSIYMSASLSTASAVNDALPGTWEAWGAGKVPVGVNTSDTDFNTAGKTGGSKTHKHNLSDNGYALVIIKGNGSVRYREKAVSSWTDNYYTSGGSAGSSSDSQGYGAVLRGETDNGSSMPPYVTCYMYKRVS